MRPNHLFSFLILVLCLGCGTKDPRAVHLVPGMGRVHYQGEPLTNAIIVFTPVEGGEFTVSASAMSDVAGHFKTTTYLSGDGIHPGHYIVTVFKEVDVSGVTNEDILKLEERGEPIPPEVIESAIPIKYNLPEQSELTVEIGKRGNTTILLELTGNR